MKPIQKLAAAVLLQGLALSAVAGLSGAQAVTGPGPEVQVAEEGADEVSASVRMLRLRSGAILWGSIQGHTPDQLVFERLDTGGTAVLPWDLLDPGEERGLRLLYGYVDVIAEEVLAKADRLTLADGTVLIGRIERRTAEHIYLKRAGSTIGSLPVPS